MTIQDATPPALGQLRRRSTPIVPAAAPRHADAPRLRPGLVPRPRLLRRLTSADTPIAMIVAPAGYGKTTLLAEWAMRDDRPFAWLSVEAIESGGDGALAALEGLVEDVGACLTSHVIVIDDAHRLAPRGSLRRITDLACRLPEGSCVVLASRRRLTAPVARLRAHRLLAEVTPRELAMTRLEAAMLLDNAGVRLDAGDVDRLVALTEGWPVALYLAALSIREQGGAHTAVEELSGGDRLVAEYIRSEVLGELSGDEVAFLRRTSILGRLSARLCDAVLDAHDSAKMLVRVTRGDVPVEPDDRCDSRFHSNRLLAEMLRAELAREEPELEPELHRRASDWHGRNGDVQQALQHALACRDGGRAGGLLWSVAPGCAGRGRAGRIREWLEPFSPAEMRAHPALALSAATYHLADGRRDDAERWADAAEHAIDCAHEPELAVGLGMIRAAVARDGIARMGQDAARARDVAPLDGAWQGIGRLLEGVARHLAGEREKARPLLEDGTRLARAEAPIIAALCHAQLALLAIDHDEWEGAEEHAEAARAALAAVPETPTGHALVLAVSALTAAHDGDVFRARGDADTAVRMLGMLGGFIPWYLAEAQIVLARAHIRLSDAETARVLLARAARNHSLSGDAVVLGEWLHDAWESADAFAAGATGAGPSLTNAELRVLRFLPSHLSFREIGERLHLSTNTVKTQALAVYRKLDVSCRSDAVARGRSVGLIDG